MKYRRCTCCVNDTTVKHIKFNEQGKCNFCQKYEEDKHQLLEFDDLEQNFLKRINKERGLHKYDCAVGFSGGKDSTYVLVKLVKVYNLKVYAYTLDNGFMSDEAKHKIDKIVKLLNVDHEYLKTDEVLLKKMYKLALEKFLSPCIACSYLGYASMINITTKVDAAVGIHGRSRPQMFRNYASEIKDPFNDFILSGLMDVDYANFKQLYLEALSKIDKYIDKTLANKIKEVVLKDANELGYRDFIAYFLYHPYDVSEVLTYIKQEVNWQAYDEVEHFDCKIHNATTYLKNKIARRLHIMPELSVMIREQTMTKEEALEILNQGNIDYPKDELKMFCKYTNSSLTLTMLKANIYAKRWW